MQSSFRLRIYSTLKNCS
uniref:Uncharacterized protein n=1 Tax=Anguilla anguilla TaxID=7936 RepID=A0A0E9PN13_ANGAN